MTTQTFAATMLSAGAQPATTQSATTHSATTHSATTHSAAGAATGGVNLMLRLESLALLIAAVVLYAHTGAGWGRFALLFLVPDVSFFGYLAGPRAGAIAYNAAHSLVGPAALALAGLALPSLLPLALIWIAHVGFDRTLGYGLKYARGFGATHLGELHAGRR